MDGAGCGGPGLRTSARRACDRRTGRHGRTHLRLRAGSTRTGHIVPATATTAARAARSAPTAAAGSAACALREGCTATASVAAKAIAAVLVDLS